jgi:hypothetical protein
MWQRLIKWLMIPLSLVLLLIGLISFPLPIPIGLPIMLLAIALLLRYSSIAKKYYIKLRKRHPQLRHLLGKKERSELSKAAETE